MFAPPEEKVYGLLWHGRCLNPKVDMFAWQREMTRKHHGSDYADMRLQIWEPDYMEMLWVVKTGRRPEGWTDGTFSED